MSNATNEVLRFYDERVRHIGTPMEARGYALAGDGLDFQVWKGKGLLIGTTSWWQGLLWIKK